ncbi:transcription termination/antitermination protein NusA [Marinomonas primoryensis]|jgi:N utilization substance protein A|uniref:Transcription termination/antitermination protein NusA n=1 Tax=Marinomonas primoryensis TaxID=178399 RepID=A0A2Z4PQP6_9GAMM|nr:transcription termination factor NusA [Marinomonas primoryensis]AWX99789.1 transcription termination/antitermination protein NusA [Marinomonas primoryensis]QKK79443.1 transcription termination/antitermination protein NusA [Marinomonas primoryensis]|tara:strand:- start:8467 stop:9957 length:1491 start_codon:yes stop_codon:yes gene_type:complete
MSKEILLVVEAVSNEKDVPKQVIFEAVEIALASAAKRRFEEDALIRVSIDQRTGDYKTYRQWNIVADEDYSTPASELTIDDSEEQNLGIDIGGIYEEEVESEIFGRIAAQTAKQVIVQKVREAERAKMVALYTEKVGKLVHGQVKKVTRDSLIVDLGENAEASLPKDQLIGRESFRMNDRIRALLLEIREDSRGAQLILSRNSPAFMIELFRLEVPEIAEEIIEIRSASRDPGLRAKIAVKTNDRRIDPIGACVGMRGARVQAVSNEMNGERVDIVLWDDNPAQLVINAMSPAEVDSIVIDEDAHSMDVAVKSDNLAQAIGRNGQNVRLASTLTGWSLNVMTSEDAEAKQQEESQKLIDIFVTGLDIDDDLAIQMVDEGFSSLEEVAYIPMEEMLDIDGFDEDLVNELRSRAKEALLNQALQAEEQLDGAKPAADLLAMEGMDNHLALVLASIGVITMEDLAEQSVDELLDVEGMTEARAASLILTARAPWFAESE